ncbi:MAG: hypothetical protein AAF653_16110 [Chloroflexota bacterium]
MKIHLVSIFITMLSVTVALIGRLIYAPPSLSTTAGLIFLCIVSTSILMYAFHIGLKLEQLKPDELGAGDSRFLINVYTLCATGAVIVGAAVAFFIIGVLP